MVIVLSVFNGFSDLAESKLSQLDPDIRVRPVTGKVFPQADSIAARIAAVEGVRTAAPELTEQAFAIVGGNQMPVTLKGMTSDGADATSLDMIIVDGVPLITQGGDTGYSTAVLSVGAAVQLNARPDSGYLLRVYVPRRTGRINPANPMTAFRADSLLVAGVYQVEQPEYDTDMILLPLADTRRLLQYSDGEASSIEVFVADGCDVTQAVTRVSAMLGDRYEVLDRIQQQQQAFRMIEIEKWVTFLMLTFILVITSFNIISSIYILKVEKAGNMYVLNAMGAPRRLIARIFAWQGRLITLAGGAIGIVLGVALSLAQQYGGFIRLGASDMSAMSIDSYPVRVAPADVLIVMAIVTLVALAASFIATVSHR